MGKVSARLCASILAAVALIALGATRASAQVDEGWAIERFAAEITVRADASILVTETLEVDFGRQEKHGIFREIPIRYDFNERQERVYDLRVRNVIDASGKGLRYERADEGRFARIRIGDRDRTVSGRQTYRIVYEVQGALNAFPDHDELYWNVSGKWPAVMRAASVRVRLERGEATRVACFQGGFGSDETCRATTRTGGADMSATRALIPSEELTVVVAFPKGAVAEPKMKLEDRPREIDAWWDLTPATLGGAALVLLAGIGLLGRRWVIGGRDPEGRVTIVPEYGPPDRLRPAEVGLLVDESADPKDLTATIVDLAVRGYLSIEEVSPKGLFAGHDWTLHRGKPADDGLADYERRLLTGLFGSGREVTLSSLKGTFHETLSKAQGDLYRDSVMRSWFPSDPSGVRNAWRGIAIATVEFGTVATALLGIFYGAGLVGVAAVLVGVVALLWSGAMPKKTAQGQELLRRILGFRRYMDTAETHRQQFAERENIFAEYLPYAIVFGLVSKWARAFEGLDAQKAVEGWYTGSSIASIGAFSSGLADFSSSVSSVIATTPASTGGSSGSSGFSGGSSGGGGGGGGGGSW
ncbi:MAG: DUF2207 domain-containing protein [Chloroflexi bacterium]|nr:DUF2207 domain-containing protein [Chloroflexota bacterium]